MQILTLVALSCAIASIATGAPQSWGEYIYESTLDNDAVIITGYTGTCSHPVIPAEIDGLPVVQIGLGAFAGNRIIVGVDIPDSITSIGYQAFVNCTSLESIVIPDSVYGMASGIFWGCISLTNVTLSASLGDISSHMFYGCANLAHVVIPDAVIQIGDEAFTDCTQLDNIIIPDSVLWIHEAAFRRCHNLSDISIPQNVAFIGFNAFDECSSLERINVVADNVNYSSVDGVLFYHDRTTILKYPPGKTTNTYEIPPGVREIGRTAFSDSIHLTCVTIPAGVANIGNGAFLECRNLTDIEMPPSLTTIGRWAFGLCESLTTLDIPSGVTSVGEFAFYMCAELQSVTIPRTVSHIADQAFGRCGRLTNIMVAVENEYYESHDGVLFDAGSTTLIQYPGGKTGAYVIPDGVTVIAQRAFSLNEGVTQVMVPGSVKDIAYAAFEHCGNLASILFSGPPPSLGGEIFFGSLPTLYYRYAYRNSWDAEFAGRQTAMWPEFGTALLRQSNLALMIRADNGQEIIVQATDNLLTGTWTDIMSFMMPEGDILEVTIPYSENHARRFFSILLP
jgi:hypothetical protein